MKLRSDLGTQLSFVLISEFKGDPWCCLRADHPRRYGGRNHREDPPGAIAHLCRACLDHEVEGYGSARETPEYIKKAMMWTLIDDDNFFALGL